MNRFFTEEHELFRQSAKQFIQAEVVPFARQWEQEEALPRDLFTKMGTQGFLGINFPEEYGGTDNDFWYSVVWLEEIARSGLGGFAAAVSVHQFMATNHILNAGCPSLKEHYLKPAIAGIKVGSIAISEPGAGSDVAAMRTTARREGDYYLLNGNKTFITNGYYGNFVTVACKTDPEAGMAGISLLVVDQKTAGFTTSRLHKMGWKCSDTAELFFDNVKVPASHLIGQEGKGFLYIMESFQLERLVAAILAVAGAEMVVESTLRYMHERSAFGRPIVKFQTLRHRMATLISELEIVRQFVYHSCDLFSRGVFCVKECSMAKMKATELAKTVADECLQMFGGYGWMEEYPIERAYRDARIGTIVGGTTEIMKEIIAKITIDGINYESAYKAMKAAPDNEQTSAAPPKTTSAEHTGKEPARARDIIHALPERLKVEKLNDTTALCFPPFLGQNYGVS